MSYIPEDDKARKMTPLFAYLTRYFPKAHREVTKVCVVNNVRYNPDRAPNDINWARGKSPDQLGSAFRHMMERQVDGKVFEDVPPEVAKLTGIERVYVLAEAMWRIGAQLEKDIEEQEAKKPFEPLKTSLKDAPCADGRPPDGEYGCLGRKAVVPTGTTWCLWKDNGGIQLPAPRVGCECANCAKVREQATLSI